MDIFVDGDNNEEDLFNQVDFEIDFEFEIGGNQSVVEYDKQEKRKRDELKGIENDGALKKNKIVHPCAPFYFNQIKNDKINVSRKEYYFKYMNDVLIDNPNDIETVKWWIDILSRVDEKMIKEIVCGLELEVAKYSSVYCSLILSKVYLDKALLPEIDEYLSLKHLMFSVDKNGVKKHRIYYYMGEIRYFSKNKDIKNIDNAVTNYEKAASLGDPFSMFKLAKHLLTSFPNKEAMFFMAKGLLEKAARCSLENAIIELARIYRGLYGGRVRFVKPDFKKSIEYYNKISKTNLVAQRELGLLLVGSYGIDGLNRMNFSLDKAKMMGVSILREAGQNGCLEAVVDLVDISYKKGGAIEDIYDTVNVIEKFIEENEKKSHTSDRLKEIVKNIRHKLFEIYKQNEEDGIFDVNKIYKFYLDCYKNHLEEFKVKEGIFIFRRLRDMTSTGQIPWSPSTHFPILYKPSAKKAVVCLLICVKHKNLVNPEKMSKDKRVSKPVAMGVLCKVVVMIISSMIFQFEIDRRKYGKQGNKSKISI